MTLSSPARIWLLVFVSLLLTSCSEATYEVAGTVCFADGTPISGGQVEFRSVDREISAVGFIDSRGAFKLSTNGDQDGAYVGDYRVALQPPPFPILIQGQGEQGRKDIAARAWWLARVPARYRDPNTSGVEISVDGASDGLKIIVEPTPLISMKARLLQDRSGSPIR